MSGKGRRQRTRHAPGPSETESHVQSPVPENTETPVTTTENTETPVTTTENNEAPVTTTQKNENWRSVGGQKGTTDKKPQSSKSHQQHKFDGKRGRGGYRGGKRPERHFSARPQTGNSSESNVAFAEEREYEAVMFMESKSKENEEDIAKKEEELKKKQEVISNWQNFEVPLLEDDIISGEDYLVGEDFSEIIKQSENAAVSTYFQLKSEQSWGKADSTYLDAVGLGRVEFSNLAVSLSTVPFHIQMDMPEKVLPSSIVTYYTELAEEKKSHINPDIMKTCDVTTKLLEKLSVVPEVVSTEDFSGTTSNFVNEKESKFNFEIPEVDDINTQKIVGIIGSHERSCPVKVESDELDSPIPADADIVDSSIKVTSDELESPIEMTIDELDAPIKVERKEVYVKSEKEQLEDWLDDFLDD